MRCSPPLSVFLHKGNSNYLKSLLLVPSSGDLSFTSLVSEWRSPPLPLKSIITQEMSASYRLIHDGGRVEKVRLQFRSLSSILWWGLQDTKEQTVRMRCAKRSVIYLQNVTLNCITYKYAYTENSKAVQKLGSVRFLFWKNFILY